MALSQNLEGALERYASKGQSLMSAMFETEGTKPLPPRKRYDFSKDFACTVEECEVEWVPKKTLEEDFGLSDFWLKYTLEYEKNETGVQVDAWFITLNFIDDGIIVVDDVKRYAVEWRLKPGDSVAAVENKKKNWCPVAFSKVMWACWKSACSEYDGQPRSLKLIVHHQITNPTTKDLCKKIALPIYQAEDKTFRLRKKYAGRRIILRLSDAAFQALLASPNGNGQAYLCIENRKMLISKVVTLIELEWKSEGYFNLFFRLGPKPQEPVRDGFTIDGDVDMDESDETQSQLLADLSDCEELSDPTDSDDADVNLGMEDDEADTQTSHPDLYDDQCEITRDRVFGLCFRIQRRWETVWWICDEDAVLPSSTSCGISTGTWYAAVAPS